MKSISNAIKVYLYVTTFVLSIAVLVWEWSAQANDFSTHDIQNISVFSIILAGITVNLALGALIPFLISSSSINAVQEEINNLRRASLDEDKVPDAHFSRMTSYMLLKNSDPDDSIWAVGFSCRSIIRYCENITGNERYLEFMDSCYTYAALAIDDFLSHGNRSNGVLEESDDSDEIVARCIRALKDIYYADRGLESLRKRRLNQQINNSIHKYISLNDSLGKKVAQFLQSHFIPNSNYPEVKNHETALDYTTSRVVEVDSSDGDNANDIKSYIRKLV